MKRIIFFIICVNVFYYSLSQNITSDTTIAGRSYRKARSMPDNRQFDKLDSILILSREAAGLYAKNQVWNMQLSSLCNQIEVYCRQSDELQTLISS